MEKQRNSLLSINKTHISLAVWNKDLTQKQKKKKQFSHRPVVTPARIPPHHSCHNSKILITGFFVPLGIAEIEVNTRLCLKPTNYEKDY